jgi:hypothetical protein
MGYYPRHPKEILVEETKNVRMKRPTLILGLSVWAIILGLIHIVLAILSVSLQPVDFWILLLVTLLVIYVVRQYQSEQNVGVEQLSRNVQFYLIIVSTAWLLLWSAWTVIRLLS